MYGTGAVTSFGFSGGDYSGGTQLKPRSTGFTAGAFYTLPTFNRFKAGLDARFTSAPGYNGGKASTVAFRLGFVPDRFLLRPYAEFGGGTVRTESHQGTCSGFSCSQSVSRMTSGVVRFGAGLDVHVNRLFDIRPVDYEYDTGGAAGIVHATMRSFSAGLVLHLRAPTLKPR